jgi:hypothetical protein
MVLFEDICDICAKCKLLASTARVLGILRREARHNGFHLPSRHVSGTLRRLGGSRMAPEVAAGPRGRGTTEHALLTDVDRASSMISADTGPDSRRMILGIEGS